MVFSLLCGVYFNRGDVSVAIYKIGKIGEFLPKLYFFGVGVFLGDFFISGVNSRLFFLCQKGFGGGFGMVDWNRLGRT